MTTLFAAIGRFTVRFRYLVVVAWLVAAVACVHFLPSLSSVEQTNNSSLLPSNAPSVQAERLAAPFGGKQASGLTLVGVSTTGTVTTADEAAAARAVRAVERVPGVTFARNLGLAPDGKAFDVLVGSDVGRIQQSAQSKLVDAIDRAVAATPLPSGFHLYLTGQVPINVANQHANKRTGNKIQSLSVLFIVVLLLLVFRAVLAPFVTLVPALLAVAISGPLIAEASTVGVPVSVLTQFMLIVIVLGAGTDYGLFLVFRVREELRRGLDKREAVVHALSRVGESITFSAATVIGAFLTLLIATFGVYKSLGPPLAIAIGVMLLAGLTLLPALLAIFGRAVFWPSRTVPGGESLAAGSFEDRPGLWGRVAAAVVRRPVPTLLLGVIVLGGIGFAVLGNRPAGFGGALNAPAGTPAAAGSAALAANFPKAAANPTNVILRYRESIWADPAPIEAASAKLERSGLFSSLIGPLDPNGIRISASQLVTLHDALGRASGLAPVAASSGSVDVAGRVVSARLYNAYRATVELVSEGGHTVQFEANLAAGPPSSTAAMNAIPEIRSAVAKVAASTGATRWGVGGEAAGLYDVSNTSNHDLLHILPVAIVVIGILIGLVLRSVVAPWYLVATVALSYFAALGVSVIAFIEIGHSDGLTFFLPFLMFLFLLALGEDYNILMLTRIREEAAKLPLREAVQKAVGVTGTTVTSAGLVLAGTFSVLAFAGGSGPQAGQIRDIGFGLAIGILLDTFVVRTLLVPSAVVLVGRVSWWPSHLARRHLEEPGATDAVGKMPVAVGRAGSSGGVRDAGGSGVRDAGGSGVRDAGGSGVRDAGGSGVRDAGSSSGRAHGVRGAGGVRGVRGAGGVRGARRAGRAEGTGGGPGALDRG